MLRIDFGMPKVIAFDDLFSVPSARRRFGRLEHLR